MGEETFVVVQVRSNDGSTRAVAVEVGSILEVETTGLCGAYRVIKESQL